MIELIIIVACALYIFSKMSDGKKKSPRQRWQNKPKTTYKPNLSPHEPSVPAAYESMSSKSYVSIELEFPHKKSDYLTTENERRFYMALVSGLSDEYCVHCQTSLMALVQPLDRKHNSRTWAKRMDFVITDKYTKVLAVVELDDRTHNWESRKKRDKYVNSVLKGHHPLIRFESERVYCPDKISMKILTELGIHQKSYH